MTLATKCPHCCATFKVALDQLKLRNGLVRCGICQHIFNGMEHLVEHPAATSEPPPSPTQEPNSVEHRTDFSSDSTTNTAVPSSPPTLSFIESDAVEEVIVLKPNLINLESSGEKFAKKNSALKTPIEAEQTTPPVEQAFIDDSHHSDITSQPGNVDPPAPKEIPYQRTAKQNETTHLEQPSFILQANTKKRRSRMMLVGTLVLSLMLVGQITYVFRDLITATFPATKSTLETLCRYVHCQIQLPMQIKSISYEADELLSRSDKNSFEFSLILRNSGQVTQTWPHIELVLKNAQKQAVLRRVFSPVEYLIHDNEIRTGFTAHHEQAVKLFFTLDQLSATDYSVALFYP